MVGTTTAPLTTTTTTTTNGQEPEEVVVGSTSTSDQKKRDDFRRYLDRTGVLDALTKAMVALYEERERPTNALDYLRNFLGKATGEASSLSSSSNNTNHTNNDEVQRLREENARLQQELDQVRRQGAVTK